MKLSFVLFFTSLLFASCTSTIQLSSEADANKKIGKGGATIYLKSGREFSGRQLFVRADSIQFVDADIADTLRFPTDDVESIEVRHHGGGAFEGFIFGGLGGCAFGLTAGLGASSSGEAGAAKGLLVFTGLTVGSVGGLVIGAIKGHTYTFIPPTDSTTIPSGSLDIGNFQGIDLGSAP